MWSKSQDVRYSLVREWSMLEMLVVQGPLPISVGGEEGRNIKKSSSIFYQFIWKLSFTTFVFARDKQKQWHLNMNLIGYHLHCSSSC